MCNDKLSLFTNVPPPFPPPLAPPCRVTGYRAQGVRVGWGGGGLILTLRGVGRWGGLTRVYGLTPGESEVTSVNPYMYLQINQI